jgi:RNA polymerase sigma-70 factor (ECF subfamily)
VFCEREFPRLAGALTLYTGSVELGRELAQEASARACAHWDRLQRMDAPGAWVHRVGLNLARKEFTRRARQRELVARLARRTESEHVDELASALSLRAAVAGLPDRQRAALIARYYLDASVVDAALMLRCRPGTVKALTHQALAALRRELTVTDPSEVDSDAV